MHARPRVYTVSHSRAVDPTGQRAKHARSSQLGANDGAGNAHRGPHGDSGSHDAGVTQRRARRRMRPNLGPVLLLTMRVSR